MGTLARWVRWYTHGYVCTLARRERARRWHVGEERGDTKSREQVLIVFGGEQVLIVFFRE